MCTYEQQAEILEHYVGLIEDIINGENRKLSLDFYRGMVHRIRRDIEGRYSGRTDHHAALRRFELLEPDMTRILGTYAPES